jgi:hypothetical protein
VDPILLVVTGWWWIAPAAAGVGAVGYSALTTRSRRARRLELDAARHEELLARQALTAARANARNAQADLMLAQSQRRSLTAQPGSVSDARRALWAAKQAQKDASLALRAARTRVKAAYTQRAAGGPLPLERVMAAHDAVTARWLSYETDAALALAYPQMSDSRHPITYAFLQAQHEAHIRRPESPRSRITPADFVAYRDAVRRLESAFAAAEAAARQAAVAPPRSDARARRMTPSPSPGPAVAPGWAVPGRVEPPAGEARREQRPSRPIWPVPRRDGSGTRGA